MNKAIVLLSGGQDSTTCLYWALEWFDPVIPIGFDYGQSHSVELHYAQAICSDLKLPYKTFSVKNLLAKSSLNTDGDHNKKSYLDEQLPASFTAGRNILFLTIAGSYGAEIGANDIVTGVCQTDYSGYPDCRRTSITAMETVLSLAFGNGDYRVHTPLMYLTKAETWRMAKKLNCLDVIVNKTITGYDGDQSQHEWGRGNPNNPASALRIKGFYEAKEKGWI